MNLLRLSLLSLTLSLILGCSLSEPPKKRSGGGTAQEKTEVTEPEAAPAQSQEVEAPPTPASAKRKHPEGVVNKEIKRGKTLPQIRGHLGPRKRLVNTAGGRVKTSPAKVKLPIKTPHSKKANPGSNADTPDQETPPSDAPGQEPNPEEKGSVEAPNPAGAESE